MLKWGSSELLSPVFRRGYTEVLNLLSWNPDGQVDSIPKEVFDFLVRNRDLSHSYEVTQDNADEMMYTRLSWGGFLVAEMLYRYFWCTEEDREEYDKLAAMNEKRILMFIQMRVDGYIKQCEKNGTPFQRMELSELKEWPKACAQALTVLNWLPAADRKGYVRGRIPKEYIWLLEMFRMKGYKYDFILEKCEDEDMVREKEPLEDKAVEILADITYRYWREFQFSPEELALKLPMITWE